MAKIRPMSMYNIATEFNRIEKKIKGALVDCFYKRT